MAILDAITSAPSRVWHYFMPKADKPNLEEGIVARKALELVAWRFEPIDPAVDRAKLKENFEAYVIHVAAMRLANPSNHLKQTLEREAALDRQRQHIEKAMGAALEGKNKSEQWQRLGAFASLAGFVAPKAPALIGGQLTQWFGGRAGARGFLERIYVWKITDPSAQKFLRKQMQQYLPGVPPMLQRFGETEGHLYNAKNQSSSALSQTWQGKAEAANGRRQDYKQNVDALQRSLTTFIETAGRVKEKIAQAGSSN